MTSTQKAGNVSSTQKGEGLMSLALRGGGVNVNSTQRGC